MLECSQHQSFLTVVLLFGNYINFFYLIDQKNFAVKLFQIFVCFDPGHFDGIVTTFSVLFDIFTVQWIRNDGIWNKKKFKKVAYFKKLWSFEQFWNYLYAFRVLIRISVFFIFGTGKKLLKLHFFNTKDSFLYFQPKFMEGWDFVLGLLFFRLCFWQFFN